MVTRKCLVCGVINYSADTFSEFWDCCKCGNKISKSQEKPIPKEGENNDKM
jgi:ribosomal protein L37AE/L43A